LLVLASSDLGTQVTAAFVEEQHCEPGRFLLVQLSSLVPAGRRARSSWKAEAQCSMAMAGYAVAHLVEIDEISDGRRPFGPIRHNFGITSFGVNTRTGREAGDRIINEHDEAGEEEELYVVQSGRATFELDGERVDAPAGRFVFARPGVNAPPTQRSGRRRSSRSGARRRVRTSQGGIRPFVLGTRSRPRSKRVVGKSRSAVT
jgi:mannose-6-phosphate isomerase-like protein (cupin superfamily)